MVIITLSRPTRVEVISVLQEVFSRSAWLDILVTRIEMAFTDAGGEVTVNVALWGCDEEVERELKGVGIRT